MNSKAEPSPISSRARRFRVSAFAAADPAAHVTRAAFRASRQVIGAAYAATRVTRAALTALGEAQNKLLLRYLNGEST
jgi:hypothetical protein